eukprot:TRINITY_DN2534_c0_g1_i1.p1 TRINITY_DN2534_c0_g1~~TRINITY_DN2534_c0_g1_i1.p1  ORF type:complete len:360 (+),score=84.48 TRINITY_DN2534_c0_g1_i1:611-1690(+)
MESMACPDRYKRLGDFPSYYRGEKVAPVLTLFIGGNHESSLYCQEIPHGGWVAPNIYYMGYSNVMNFGGLRIAGISGIFTPHDYHKGHFEMPPYNNSTKRSIYHMREFDVWKMMHIQKPVDIMLSHDWPNEVEQFGNVQELIKKKKHFKKEIEEKRLGNPATKILLNHLKPKYWFSAHMHVKYAAIVPHENDNTTKFLCLDKCLPYRDFIQVLDFPLKEGDEKILKYDTEWLGIVKKSIQYESTTNEFITLPDLSTSGLVCSPSEEDIQTIISNMDKEGINNQVVPNNFVVTAMGYIPNFGYQHFPRELCINAQTTQLLNIIGVGNTNEQVPGDTPETVESNNKPQDLVENNPDEIQLF